ncbi:MULTISPECIES: LysR family transcriptional regulator [unclassified Blastococcus]
MDLNLHLVRHLVAVVDDGHFGRAAERLYLSAPALSQSVRKLERALGVPLLDRSAHPVRPTPAGEGFLAEAREALAAADRAVAAVMAHRRRQASTLRLGFMTAPAGWRIRQLLDQLAREVPEVSVDLVELPWAQQVSSVREGVVDASLVRLPFSDTRGLRFDPVHLEKRVVALPALHPLAVRPAVELRDLDGEPHVTDEDADPAWVRWWACDPRPSGVAVRYGPSVRTMDALLEVVASRQAIAITGEFVAASYRHPEVAFLPVLDAESAMLALCTRATDPSPLVAALRRATSSVRDADASLRPTSA